MAPVVEMAEKSDHVTNREVSLSRNEIDALPTPNLMREILLVEDYEQSGRVMMRLLGRMGYRVTWAQSLAEARELAGKHRFDLLISDLDLPDGTGHDLMMEFSTKYGLRGVALSGSVMERDFTRSSEVGFLNHLIKPIDFTDLEKVLKRLLG